MAKLQGYFGVLLTLEEQKCLLFALSHFPIGVHACMHMIIKQKL